MTFNSDQMHTNLKTRSASRHHVITLSRVGVFFQNDRLGQSFKMQYSILLRDHCRKKTLIFSFIIPLPDIENFIQKACTQLRTQANLKPTGNISVVIRENQVKARSTGVTLLYCSQPFPGQTCPLPKQAHSQQLLTFEAEKLEVFVGHMSQRDKSRSIIHPIQNVALQRHSSCKIASTTIVKICDIVLLVI